jgi:hypothetical protein
MESEDKRDWPIRDELSQCGGYASSKGRRCSNPCKGLLCNVHRAEFARLSKDMQNQIERSYVNASTEEAAAIASDVYNELCPQKVRGNLNTVELYYLIIREEPTH